MYYIPLGVNLVICYGLAKKKFMTECLSETKKMTIFVLCFGITTINGDHYSSDLQMFIFITLLLVNYLENHNVLSTLIKIMRYVLAFEIAFIIYI